MPPPAGIPTSLAEESAQPAVPAGGLDDVTTSEAVEAGKRSPSPEENVVEEAEGAGEETVPRGSVDEVESRNVEAKAEPEGKVTEEQQTVDEDEETRKRRVAEKLAKMGGVNPFAMPPMPLRRTSVGSTTSATEATAVSPPTSPPIPTKKPSIGAVAVGSPPTSPPRPVEKPASLRRGSASSVGSIEGGMGSAGRRASAGSVELPARRASVGSVRSVTKVAEVEELVEEPENTIPEEDDASVPVVTKSKEASKENEGVKKSSLDDEAKHNEEREEKSDGKY